MWRWYTCRWHCPAVTQCMSFWEQSGNIFIWSFRREDMLECCMMTLTYSWNTTVHCTASHWYYGGCRLLVWMNYVDMSVQRRCRPLCQHLLDVRMFYASERGALLAHFVGMEIISWLAKYQSIKMYVNSVSSWFFCFSIRIKLAYPSWSLNSVIEDENDGKPKALSAL